MKTLVGTIDMTPSWSALLHPMLDIISDPKRKRESKAIVTDEFKKMAQAADNWNEYCKQVKASEATTIGKLEEEGKLPS